MNRLAYVAAISLLALGPMSVDASPTPSPTLDKVLAGPPTGYVELPDAPFQGNFTAHDYAQASGSPKAAEIENTLKHEGFVDGYGQAWIHKESQHALIEAVLAFTGARGAKNWLTAAEAGDKLDPEYDHSNSMSGIGTYYGGHFKYSTTSTVGDVFSFVKGNDVFIVGVVSTKDDALNVAMTQTKTQYEQAPKETIPSSQWPENASNRSAAFQIGYILPVIVILAIVIAVVGFMLRNRRRAALTPAMAAATGAAPGAAGAVQMSSDGNQWWDGQTWRDAASEVPPTAQRSSDGALWWDGQSWRPVPASGQPQQPEPPPST